ncbi:MAG: zinc ribbon domain-containing protein [Candidatus Hodarchaeales archaeon]|jgi:hypothetical protein
MYKDKFILSILHDGHPVKETGMRYNKEVAIPFDSEYKIRLKNKNDRSCTARIFVDGKKVSQLGDVILHAGGTIDLERFIDRSLAEGKRFKFVPLDHSDVDDPTSSKNGIIRAEFRLAKRPNGVKIHPIDWVINYDGMYRYKEDNDGIDWSYTPATFTCDDTGTVKVTPTVSFCSSNIGLGSNGSGNNTKHQPLTKGMAASVENGATIEGGKSTQSFIYSDLEVEDNAVVLKLKLVGIKDTKEMRHSIYKYCSNCGHRVRRVDKYCSGCGRKL